MRQRLRTYADLAGFNERLRWVALVVLAVLVSIVEAVGAALVYVLLGLASGTGEALDVPVVGDVRSHFPGVSEGSLLLGTTGFVAGFFVLRGALVLLKKYVESRVTEHAGARLSARLAEGYLAMPYSFHLRRNSAELVRNAYDTVQHLVTQVLKPLVRIVSEGTVVLAILVVLLVVEPAATLLVLAVLGPSSYALLAAVHGWLRRSGRTAQDSSRQSIQALQQSLEGAAEIKLLGRERYFADRFAGARTRLARVRYLRDVLREVPSVGLETLLMLTIAGMFAAAVLAEGGAVGAIPLLGLFGYAALRLKPSLNLIMESVNLLRFSEAGVEDVSRDLHAVPAAAAATGSTPHGIDPLPFARELHLDGIRFRYEGAHVDALRDVDLRIRKGESIGVVGPTGGGKSTLVSIAVGLLEPTEGAVRVDGVDVAVEPHRWQQRIGLVPQTLFLVDDTLRQNIALGVRDDKIDEERMHEVVELARLEAVVGELPDGLDTVVGERGARLSGGQRQRVSIARALYRDPDVLVFDEGTSALDQGTEAALLDALARVGQHRTLITVAHRLATVRDADRIVLVEAGRIADVAPFDELVVRSSTFRTMTAER